MARSRAKARPRPAAPRTRRALASRRPKILKLVGPSGVGKTTLAERLIARWTQEGLSVGYLKHAAHGFDLDRPGKDSFRASAAGATGVCLLGPTSLAYFEAAKVDRPEDLVERFFRSHDVVLVEGFSLAAVPALLFVVAQGARNPKPPPRGQVLALIATDVRKGRRPAGKTPVLARDDLEGILRVIEPALGLARRALR